MHISAKQNYGTVKLTSNVAVTDGVITVDQHMTDPIREGAMREIVRWSVDTREAQIRAALISLGWTPPPTEDEA